MASDSADLRGGCLCGAVRYEISGPALTVAACHCTSCRRHSGAAYSVNLIVPTKAMTVTGPLAAFSDTDTESGVPLAREHCRACGTPIRSIPGSSPKIVAVKAGTLDEPQSFAPRMHLFTQSALPWVVIPSDIPSFAKGPQA